MGATLNMRPADLIFVRGKGLVVQPIKWITHSPYSHVVGYVKRDLFIGVQDFKQTKYEVLDHYQGLCDVYTCDRLTTYQRMYIISFAKRELGSRYDFKLLALQAVRFMTGIVLPVGKTDRRICSTLWADAYRAAGVDLCPGVKYPAPGEMVTSPLLRQIGTL